MIEIKNLVLLIGDLPRQIPISNSSDFIPQYKLDDPLGLTVEQIAQALDLDLEQVRQATL
jgi:hypothetical protein